MNVDAFIFGFGWSFWSTFQIRLTFNETLHNEYLGSKYLQYTYMYHNLGICFLFVFHFLSYPILDYKNRLFLKKNQIYLQILPSSPFKYSILQYLK